MAAPLEVSCEAYYICVKYDAMGVMGTREASDQRGVGVGSVGLDVHAPTNLGFLLRHDA